ncbi:hypothetical protein [Bythopirellula goksoeyrii]|uniref:Trypsin n=1 Tax=Bythopirellula goksoeyrii TaxID=1400387 RepID=A0A5B9QCA5_9BACT|nr:hypothetical protein [Bythopirellula goksoeyrii]QEG35240.1 hypothetical protein Pr1d_25340 [Bythopirellula goksoeyrii]
MPYSEPETLVQVKKAILPEILDATLLIVRVEGEQEPKFKVDRSGVFFRIAREYFILTAAHKIDQRIKTNTPLCVAVEGDPHVVELIGSDFHGTESHGRDIAIIRLTQEKAEQICISKVPLTLSKIDRCPRECNNFFLTAGYPQEWFSHGDYGFNLVPVSFFGRPFEGDPSPFVGHEYNSSIHGAFEFDANPIRSSDSLTVFLPDFNGMKGISGCGIWRIYHNPAATGEFPNSYSLSAIEHRYDRSNKYVLGTWIEIVMQRLLGEYPSLSSSFKFQYPT